MKSLWKKIACMIYGHEFPATESLMEKLNSKCSRCSEEYMGVYGR
jgi:hypothetical protein